MATPGQDAILGAIHPTLFMGLGGTGKEVLLRLRRKFYERLGVLGLPCTSYLWLDTDTQDRMAAGERIDDIYAAVAFGPHERIPLLSGAVKQDLGQVFTNKDQWRHVHKWLHPEVERYGAEISDGAGGVRAVGRLAWFHHFGDSIDPIVRDALDGVRTHEKINETKEFFKRRAMGVAEFPGESTTQVFIITSLAGGTGCGAFLDAVFHLRHLARSGGIPIERIIGVLFMPNIFYANPSTEVSQRSFGNAYAALKELEFYTLRLPNTEQDLGIDYLAEWQRGQTIKIQGPPFAINYLLEMKNEGGTPLDPKNRAEMFNVVAESLFLDFMPSDFSSAKRSHYSNVSQYLASTSGTNISFEDVVLPQAFARRYASFGMSKIEIPLDQMKAACAAHLGYAICDYIGRDAVDARIQEHVRTDMVRRKLDAEGLIERFGSEWKETIRSSIASLVPKTAFESLDEAAKLEQALSTVEQRLILSEGSDSTRWGIVIDLIRKQTNEVAKGVEADALQWLKDSLEDEIRGLKSVTAEDGYLRYFTEYMKDLYASPKPDAKAIYAQRIESAQDDAKAWRRNKAQALSELREAIRSTGLALLLRKTWTIETMLQRIQDAQEQYCFACAEECVLHQAIKIAEDTVAFLNRQRRSLDSLSTAVATASANFFKKYEDFLNFTDQVLLIRFFDRNLDWKEVYKLDTDDQGRPRDVVPKIEYQRFLTQSISQPGGPVATLWDLVQLVERRTERELRQRLQEHCDRRFWADFEAYPRQMDVLQHPRMAADWEGAIERFVRSATPLARREKIFGGSTVQVRQLAYLGIASTQGAVHEAFAEQVRRHLISKIGIADLVVQSTGRPWEAYLYLVTYAFPLASLPVVSKDCRAAYNSFYRALTENRVNEQRYHIPLHLDAAWEGKFDELVVYDDDTAKEVKEGREALLFGAVLKVVQPVLVQHRVEYEYSSGPPHYRQRKLGAKREAVERLKDEPDLRKAFLSAIRERERALADSQLLKYYWIMQYLSGTDAYATGTPEYSLLERKLVEVYDRLIAAGTPAGDLDIKAVPVEARGDYALKKASDGVEFSTAIPQLKSLEKWFHSNVAL